MKVADFSEIYKRVGLIRFAARLFGRSEYRGSPLSTNSLSTIPEVVRFINSTKSANSPK